MDAQDNTDLFEDMKLFQIKIYDTSSKEKEKSIFSYGVDDNFHFLSNSPISSIKSKQFGKFNVFDFNNIKKISLSKTNQKKLDRLKKGENFYFSKFSFGNGFFIERLSDKDLKNIKEISKIEQDIKEVKDKIEEYIPVSLKEKNKKLQSEYVKKKKSFGL